jgi:HEAT repeat protein
MNELATSDLRSDPRTTDELISAALSADNTNVCCDLVQLLQYSPSEEVIEAARLLCKSGDPRNIRLCADIMRQLSTVTNHHPEKTLEIMLALLHCEPDVDVLNSILTELWYLDLPHSAAKPILRLKDHRDASVRAAAATVIGKLLGMPRDCSRARDALIEMTLDLDKDVRIEAVVALAFSDLDDECTQRALRRCLKDVNEQVRAVALVGLAHDHRDPGVVNLLIHELSKEQVIDAALEAAARTADARLLPLLLVIKEQGKRSSWWLDVAINACSGESRDGPSAFSTQPIRMKTA